MLNERRSNNLLLLWEMIILSFSRGCSTGADGSPMQYLPIADQSLMRGVHSSKCRDVYMHLGHQSLSIIWRLFIVPFNRSVLYQMFPYRTNSYTPLLLYLPQAVLTIANYIRNALTVYIWLSESEWWGEEPRRLFNFSLPIFLVSRSLSSLGEATKNI